MSGRSCPESMGRAHDSRLETIHVAIVTDFLKQEMPRLVLPQKVDGLELPNFVVLNFSKEIISAARQVDPNWGSTGASCAI